MKKDNTLVVAILIALGIVVLGSLSFGGMMPHQDYGMMGSYWTGGFGWMGIFMSLIWILVMVFLVLGIAWLYKDLQK